MSSARVHMQTLDALRRAVRLPPLREGLNQATPAWQRLHPIRPSIVGKGGGGLKKSTVSCILMCSTCSMLLVLVGTLLALTSHVLHKNIATERDLAKVSDRARPSGTGAVRPSALWRPCARTVQGLLHPARRLAAGTGFGRGACNPVRPV